MPRITIERIPNVMSSAPLSFVVAKEYRIPVCVLLEKCLGFVKMKKNVQRNGGAGNIGLPAPREKKEE